jgi:uncharacterized membrane protein YebE (DUF533 family)
MPPVTNDAPKYSPGPLARGIVYSACALGALLYGHLSGQRPLTPFKALVLCSLAIGAGIAIAALQNWARRKS